MFRKLTPFEHHQSFMPFEFRFMTKEQYDEFVKKTHPPDVPIVVETSKKSLDLTLDPNGSNETKEPEKQQVDEENIKSEK